MNGIRHTCKGLKVPSEGASLEAAMLSPTPGTGVTIFRAEGVSLGRS